MTALEHTMAEIKEFNGETFTAVDVTNKVYLHYLVTICKVKVLPERTLDNKKIYQQVSKDDSVIKARRRERLAYWDKPTSSTLVKLPV